MTSTNIRLPDGSEARADAAICEGCNESVANHACTAGGAAPAPTVVYSRSTGPRKDPRDRPQCPHCGGSVHFSMPGGLQNTECIMRQYYVEHGVITDPYKKLPIWTAQTQAQAGEWAVSRGVTYGRMESAAGGAATYAAVRKARKNDPTEVIAEALGTPPPTGGMPEAMLPLDPPTVIANEPVPVEPEPAVVDDREARRARRRELLAARGGR